MTGAGGLVGSEAVAFFHGQGFEVVGIDNDSRAEFFGKEASTRASVESLEERLPRFSNFSVDIRASEDLNEIFMKYGSNIKLVIHAAAQPSHDWAARSPIRDFNVNAVGTLNLLEASREYAPESVFIHMSTNKVYGDMPNRLLFKDDGLRITPTDDAIAQFGFDENLSIDQSTHSIFGVSKASADLMVQEYGRYFGMRTVSFRGGCLTGPGHRGTQLHGFLSYLVKCAVYGVPYTIFGYGGKQVRDNIHSSDLVSSFWNFYKNPGVGRVYNIGGGPESNISVLEAIQRIEEIAGYKIEYSLVPTNRTGDHKWYVSDLRKFKSDYPNWTKVYSTDSILEEMLEAEEWIKMKA